VQPLPIREKFTVQTDFGSFYLRAPEPDTPLPLEDAPQAAFLSERLDPASYLLRVPIRASVVEIECLVDAAPGPLTPEWDDVAEFSVLVPPKGLAITGWEPEPSHLLPLEGEGWHRVRYSIAGTDLVMSNPDPDPCRYQLEFWPAPLAPARLVRLQSQFMRRRLATWRDPATGNPEEYPVEVPPLEA
jgi:hypothetical protein